MRRCLCLWLAALLLAALAGCGKAPGFSESDLILTVSGESYRCRDNIETVIARLGDGYQYAEGMSCNYDGLDKTYTYEAATFYTNPLPEGDLLGEIWSQSDEAATSRDIRVGAKREEVTAAYGEPAEADDYLLIYRAGEGTVPALCFELEGDRVAAIFLTMEPV